MEVSGFFFFGRIFGFLELSFLVRELLEKLGGVFFLIGWYIRLFFWGRVSCLVFLKVEVGYRVYFIFFVCFLVFGVFC